MRSFRLVLVILVVVLVLISIHPIQIDSNDITIRIGFEGAEAADSADYVCDGVADDIQFQQALDALPTNGGRLVILTGNYTFASTVTRAIPNVIIDGPGPAAYFAFNGVNPIFTAGGNFWSFRGFATDVGGINVGSTIGWAYDDINIGGTYYASYVPGNIIPTMNDTYSLGDSTHVWQEGYFGPNSVWVGTQNLSSVDGGLAVGGYKVSRSSSLIVAASNASPTQRAQADILVDDVSDVRIQNAISELVGGKVVFVGDFTKTGATGLAIPSNTTVEIHGSIKLANGIDANASIFANTDQVNGNYGINIIGGVLDGNSTNQTAGVMRAIDFVKVSGGSITAFIEGFRSGDARTRASDVIVRNLNYERPSDILNSCDNSTGITLTFNAVINNSVYAEGDGSLKLSPIGAGGANNGQATIVVPAIDARFSDLQFRFMSDEVSNIGNFWLYLTAGGEQNNIDIQTTVLNNLQNNKWYTITIPLSNWGFTSIEKLETLTSFLIEVQRTGGNPDLYFDDVRLVPRNLTPLFSINFDDGYSGAWTIGASILARYGYAGTMFINLNHEPDEIDTNYIDPAYYKYGWDVSSHGASHANLSTITSPTNLSYEVQATQQWLIDNGYSRGAYLFAFPFHTTSPSATLEVSKNMAWWRFPSSAGTYPMDFFGNSPSVMGGLTSVATAETEIDTAFLYHDWLTPYTHNVSADDDTTPTELDTILAYLYDLGAVVKTPSQILAEKDSAYNFFKSPSRTVSDSFIDVLSANTTVIRSNEDLSAAVPISFTLDTQPDVPRSISWEFDSHAQITAFSITFTGVDATGKSVSETITEASGWSGNTTLAYSTISSIAMTSRTGTGAGDTVDIGVGSKLGISVRPYRINDVGNTVSVFKVRKNGADYPSASYTVNEYYSTVDVSTGGVIVDNDDFVIYARGGRF